MIYPEIAALLLEQVTANLARSRELNARIGLITEQVRAMFLPRARGTITHAIAPVLPAHGSPYRALATSPIPAELPARRWARLLCPVVGHAWLVRATSDRAITMAGFHPLAGCLADCRRCGKRWNDLPSACHICGEVDRCDAGLHS